MIAVLDNSLLDALARADAVRVLPKMFSQVVIPPAVQEELQRDRTHPKAKEVIDERPEWLQVKAPQERDTGKKNDRGEREALNLAKELKADVFLSDIGSHTIGRTGCAAGCSRFLALVAIGNLLRL